MVTFKASIDFPLPGRFPYYFSHPLKELADTMIPCADVWGHLPKPFESPLFSAPTTSARVTLAEFFLLGRLASGKKVPDARFLAILDPNGIGVDIVTHTPPPAA